jgi:uncharacterized damage-inducible protein DinB
MAEINFGKEYLAELESEVRATRKCLEAIPESLYDWKPHHKSMNMGYLTLLVADIPRWITDTIDKSEIDLASYGQFHLSTAANLLTHFDRNIEEARRALAKVSNDDLQEAFFLKNSGAVLFTSSKKDNIQFSINHWVHHRGQLTVYMRLNDIAVPSIYGPSADERTFS